MDGRLVGTPLRPFPTVLLASFFNFIACTVFGLHVAETMGSGVVDAKLVGSLVIFGALGGAITWNVVNWRFGIPVTTTNTITGVIVGSDLPGGSRPWDGA